MIRVAVCDDMHEVVREINGYLLEYQDQNDLKIGVSNFYTAEELWEFLKTNHCDLIFLDIELDRMNGIELGKRIRNELNDQDIKIIIISAMEGYYKQLFDIQPLNFLLKPVDKVKLFEMIDLTVRLIDEKNHIFAFKNKDGLHRLKVKDILFFESYKHNFKVVTLDNTYEFRSTSSEIMVQLSGFGFIQIHRSYIVNYDQIKKITPEELLMFNDAVIPIPKEKRKETGEALMRLGGEKI